MNNQKKYFGKSILIGKSNVGKSTIINKLIKTKISIVSKKPHTTQNNIFGIKNIGITHQLIYVDTPGISTKHIYTIQNKIFKNIIALLYEVNFIFFVLDKTNWTFEDEYILKIIKKYSKPTFVIINKIDKINDKKLLLPYIFNLNKKHVFENIIPVSGKTGENINLLSNIIKNKLSLVSQHKFPINVKTTSNIYKYLSEIIREKFILYLGDELPYSIKVIITKIIDRCNNTLYIKSLILINKGQHKKIIIGKNGQKIKLCGTLARKAIEIFIKKKIYLSLEVTKITKYYEHFWNRY
ncbi:MAG: GTPase Era [Buchnera aphidicola (Chaetogeoica yunlongensis)]